MGRVAVGGWQDEVTVAVEGGGGVRFGPANECCEYLSIITTLRNGKWRLLKSESLVLPIPLPITFTTLN